MICRKRDKAEIQKNIKSLKEETKALVQLNHDLQQMLTRVSTTCIEHLVIVRRAWSCDSGS